MPTKKSEMDTANSAEEDINRARIVALAVKEACAILSSEQNQKDGWEAARQLILQNKLLTEAEKKNLIVLLQPKQSSSSSSSPSSSLNATFDKRYCFD
ncbi:hypothetical protein C1645_814414 [Glomus cerebriforme]|uniref:Uncharacterized protein n=1 Tax=Glomus cerebriforme TaxID=658196 RepID=A0A397TJR0_9GLOM|nr:hypothetical protein C1645_814414 [Glomus cerebriforme]